MSNIDLTPWTDDTFYKNYVFDCDKKALRGITEIEKLITEFCFGKTSSYSDACSELGYCRFEMEPFNSKTLLQAAKDIYEKESKTSGNKSKVVMRLVTEIPGYIEQCEKK